MIRTGTKIQTLLDGETHAHYRIIRKQPSKRELVDRLIHAFLTRVATGELPYSSAIEVGKPLKGDRRFATKVTISDGLMRWAMQLGIPPTHAIRGGLRGWPRMEERLQLEEKFKALANVVEASTYSMDFMVLYLRHQESPDDLWTVMREVASTKSLVQQCLAEISDYRKGLPTAIASLKAKVAALVPSELELRAATEWQLDALLQDNDLRADGLPIQDKRRILLSYFYGKRD